MPAGKLYEKNMGNFFFCILNVTEERSGSISTVFRTKMSGIPNAAR